MSIPAALTSRGLRLWRDARLIIMAGITGVTMFIVRLGWADERNICTCFRQWRARCPISCLRND